MSSSSSTGTLVTAPTIDPAVTAILGRIDVQDIDKTDAEVLAELQSYVQDEVIAYIQSKIMQDRFPWLRQGVSKSVSAPTEDLSSLTNNTIFFTIDGTGASEIELTLANCTTGALTAAELQTQIQAEKSSGDAGFWAWSNTIVEFSGGFYVVTSPSYGERSIVLAASDDNERDVIAAMGLSPYHGGTENPGQARDEILESSAARIATNMYRARRQKPELFEKGVSIVGAIAAGLSVVDDVAMATIMNRRPIIV